ncbi:MaoC/PaaZ C-terminal domain-containing protein [Ramlibacter alkalitolerans]|uniref:MaoC family dehydratase N-terminal domain-containing protein n=1 Tax=Ramlibacter alkalitolerans TaxID=2039631 RepID=A0ABS1JM08_9BURK|nr:MaoC/PaaZ C-terminal domain-containing protein [Ramlibacter alkalitolerans]MBL0425263.1 MaoC family dehydratase N-terminal domain-containing protein [Ramlibacter alkalitolerans]
MIDPKQLFSAQIPEIEQRYGWRDCALYALGIGVGLDPMDEADLPFLDETRLKVHPSMADVLGYPGFWMRDPSFGIDAVRTVHGEHAFRIHRPLPAEGHVRGVSRIVDLVDKGRERGALVYVEREIRDVATNELLATVNQTVFCRGDGGFGGKTEAPAPHPLPDRAPDTAIEHPTSPQGALVYRLSGDYNPLHSDPRAARAAGFERPILHGLATFGATCHGLMKRLCDSDPAAVRALGGRFSAPVFPGDTLRIEIWREGRGRFAYRTSVPARQVVVVNNGWFEVAA